MKTLAYATVMATVAVAAAHAQSAYEVMKTSTTETVGGVTTNVQTNYVSTTTTMPMAIGDAPATPTETSDHWVSVKLPSGEMIKVADSDATPWRKDPRLTSYDRFTFDADSGAFVAGMGDAKYASNWDENGNRVKKATAPAPKKAKKVVKKAVVQETTTTTEPAVPADGGMDSSSSPAESAPATEGK